MLVDLIGSDADGLFERIMQGVNKERMGVCGQ